MPGLLFQKKRRAQRRAGASGALFIQKGPVIYQVYRAFRAAAIALQAGGPLKGSAGAFSAVAAALAVVDRNKCLLQQGEVDAMAQAILDAISGLEKKPAPTPAPAPQVPAADAGQKANPKTGVAK